MIHSTVDSEQPVFTYIQSVVVVVVVSIDTYYWMSC